MASLERKNNMSSHTKHKFDFSVNKEVGIQLTERQLLLRQRRNQAQIRRPLEAPLSSNDTANGVEMKPVASSTASTQQQEVKPKSVASITVARADQKEFLKRVLASKAKSTAAQSSVSALHDKAYLRRVLATSQQQPRQDSQSDASSTVSSATTSASVQNQKALLRQVLMNKTKKVDAENVESQENYAMEMKTLNNKSQRLKEASPEKPFSRPSIESESRQDEETSLSSRYSRTSSSRSISASSDASAGSDGYSKFLATLKREVAGDHTELWKSFQLLFHDDVPPLLEKPKRSKFDSTTKKQLTEMNLYLKRSYDVECVAETQLVNDKKLAKLQQQDSDKPEKRGSIQEHSFLKRLESATSSHQPTNTRQRLEAVKRNILVTTQDASSRRLSVDDSFTPVIVHDAVLPKSEDDTKLPDWPDENDSNQVAPLRTSDICNKENLECLSPQFNGSTTSSVFSTSNSALSEMDVPQQQSHDRHESWRTSHRRKQAMGATSLLDKSTESLPDEDENDTNGEQVQPISTRQLSSRESIVDNGRRTSLLDTVVEDERIDPKEPDTPNSLSARKRTISSSRVTSDPPDTTSFAPWANIKLKSRPKPPAIKQPDGASSAEMKASSAIEYHPGTVAVHRRSTSSSTSTTTSSTSQGDTTVESDVPPWMVKLRSVSKSKDADVVSDASSDNTRSQSDVSSFRKQLRKVPSELNAVKRKEKESKLAELGITKTPEKKTLADLSWAPVSNKTLAISTQRKSNICGIVQGDDIDLSDLPVDAFGTQNDIAVVDLDRIPGMPEEHKLSVVVGKNVILEARSVEGVQLSRVNWRVSRSDVKSLALDMADRRADIVLHGRKPRSLIFGSAEGCLRFANVFYETGKEANSTPVEEPAVVVSSDPVVDESDSMFDQGSVAPNDSDGLTDEEKQLLEAFRQKRKTKSSQEAMREIQSNWTSDTDKAVETPTSTHSGLSEEEEKIAETYRKMLKVSIPPEAVRHKMTKDGVDEKIVSAVLSNPNQELKPSTTGLSGEEERIAETYRKMLRLRIPPDAVRHKMTKDQVDSRIIEAVFGSSNLSESNTKHSQEATLSEEDEKLAASYRKMLKMMIPAEAVRHKMKKDQANKSVIIAVFGPDAADSSGTEQEKKCVLSAEEEAVATSYRKMLKMMIPPEAVRHKMKKDQVDSKIVAAILGVDPDEEETKGKKPDNALSDADEQIAATYRKMLRMKVPPDGVRHKMVKNGVSEHVIKAVLGADITKAKPKKAVEVGKKPTAQGSKLVSLHWTPLSGEALDNSIWRASKKRKGVAQPEGSDIPKLVELFQKKTNKRAASSTDAAGGSGKGDDGMARLIDLNRANNLAISLKAFKDFSHDELADTIAHVDPLRKITGERVMFLKDLLPTPTEVKVIKAYKGDDNRLVPAELFLTKIVRVSRVQTKIQVMQTMDTLTDSASELGEKFVLLERVCSQIMDSERLEEVLDMVLQIGNIMNEGTRTGGAAGFKFDSLLKLTQTKSSDGKMTVLDYIVMIFAAKEKRETLQLMSDFPDCHAAGKMLITDMVNEVNNLNASLKKCETELENLRKDNGEIPPPSDEIDPRAALMAALKKKAATGTEEPKKPKNFGKRDAFLAAIEARKTSEPPKFDRKPDAEQDGGLSPPMKEPFVAKDASLKSGIQRLEAFISDAKAVLKSLEEERDRAIDACKSLSRYCGESGGERATSTLINILSQFATNLENAVKKYDERKQVEQRKEAAAQKRKEQQRDTKVDTKPTAFEKKAKKPSEPITQGQSLVLMVNELLREAPEDAKEDFKKGVVYIDPDDKLRAIYKKERESLGIFVPPDARKPSQVDLLIAIKKRRERADARRESIASTAVSGSSTSMNTANDDKVSISQGCNIGDSCISK